MGVGSSWLDAEGVRELRKYKYVALPGTRLDALLGRWWEFVVAKFVPLWVAPNCLTLGGFLCVVCAFLLTTYFSQPRYEQGPGSAVCFAVALLLFGHQTLDGIDGKQARRTGSSSPLGQVFDHGCDAFTVLLWGVCGIAALRFGLGKCAVALLSAMQLLLFVYGWLELHFHVFKSDTAGVGTSEGQTAIICGNLIVGVVGVLGWRHPIDTTLTSLLTLPPSATNFLQQVLSNRVFESLMTLSVSATLIGICAAGISVAATFDLLRGLYRMKSQRSVAMRQVAVFLVQWTAQLALLTSPVAREWSALCIVLTSTNAAVVVIRLQLCAVTKTNFNAVQPAIIPFVITSFACHVCPSINFAKSTLTALSVWTAAYVSQSVYLTVHKICNELRISCFSIASTRGSRVQPPRKAKKAE